MNISDKTMAVLQEMTKKMNVSERLLTVFIQCFANTLQTTTSLEDDGTTFIFTGDIPAMWLRDSSAQVRHYIDFAVGDPELQRVIEGLIQRQMRYILIDPYANAFNRDPNSQRLNEDRTKQCPWVWERKYEIDSLCYPLQLGYLYWKATGRTAHFDDTFIQAAGLILDVWQTEQNHMSDSPYLFERNDCPPSDTLAAAGKGTPVGQTGMTWSGFRPSDDACKYGYLIPSNMFAVVVLQYLEEIAATVYQDQTLAGRAALLRAAIDAGIQRNGIVRHPVYGDIYAYEVDGLGQVNLMDDANVPSLLSIPYLGYRPLTDPIYQNTRNFVLSKSNPNYFIGRNARGIGSPHTPPGYIWPIGMIMQALTSADPIEIDIIIGELLQTDAGTGLMHESFDPDEPARFTRAWFAWANSLFAELLIKKWRSGSDKSER